ncbi:MAG: hypothetical protein JSV90_05015 [Methanobacteriota archaeon]|nr:MAG: hypothetical protein JSV90_05015 [Euryarchaeota archaeon]
MTTLNLQVGAGANDADEADDGSDFSYVRSGASYDSHTSDASARYNVGTRWPSLAVPKGATIDSATYWCWCLYTVGEYDDIDVVIYAEDVDDADDFATTQDVTSRTRTSASVAWQETGVTPTAFNDSPDIKTVIQEVIDRAGWVENNDMVLLVIGGTTYNRIFPSRSYETGDGSSAPKLDIDYTPGGTAGRVASSRGVMRGVRRGVS